MSSLPSVSGRDAIRAFERLGFVVDRVTGSHHILKKSGHPAALSVPVHGNKSLKRGTLRALIADAGVTVEEFESQL
jgi:predicted RNA binding protein YcfA (HicA-like mRNA interferase family)